MKNPQIIILISLNCLAEKAFAGAEKQSPGISFEHYSQVLLVLLGIIALIFICTYFIKKLSLAPGVSNENIEVLTSLSVGTRDKLVVVEIAKQQFLLGISQGNIQNLHHFPDAPIKKSSNSNASFIEQFRNVMQQGKFK